MDQEKPESTAPNPGPAALPYTCFLVPAGAYLFPGALVLNVEHLNPSLPGCLETLSPDHLRDAYALEVALASMPVGISWARVEDQEIIFTNRKFRELFGYTEKDFTGVADWIERAYPFPEDRDLARSRWSRYFLHPKPHENTLEPMEIRVLCKNGDLKTVIVSGVILPDTGWALATFVDITDIRKNEAALNAAKREALENQIIYKTLLDHSPDMMVISPLDGAPRYVSAAVKAITGFEAEQYLTFQGFDFMHADDRGRATAILDEMRAGVLSHVFRYRALRCDGDYRWVEATVTGYGNAGTPGLAGYIATIRDCTDQKQREDELAAENLLLSHAALHDELTGLLNRRGFNALLHKESLRQTRAATDLSLLLLDVDCFKQFNDTYGHPAGDDCLKAIANAVGARLRRDSDVFARHGGEEFICLLPTTSAKDVHNLAVCLLKAVSTLAIPHAGSSHRVVTVSIGAATWVAGSLCNPQELVAQADAALYRAKNSGRNTVFSPWNP